MNDTEYADLMQDEETARGRTKEDWDEAERIEVEARAEPREMCERCGCLVENENHLVGHYAFCSAPCREAWMSGRGLYD